MPIRANRGRSATHRAWLTWPMKSKRHLAITGAGLSVALITFGVAAGSGGWVGGDPTPGAHPASTSVTLPPAEETRVTLPPIETETATTPPAPAQMPVSSVPPEALQTAEGFARAFANHPPGMSAQQWAEGLRPFVTPETGGMLGTTDPARVDVTAVAGPPVPTRATARVAHVEVPVNNGRLALVLVHDGTRWAVRSYDKVQP